MAKFNKGYKLLKFYRNRFSAKREGRGIPSNNSAEGEKKNLPCELRLSVPFGLLARQTALVQVGLSQSCEIMDLIGEVGCRGWGV